MNIEDYIFPSDLLHENINKEKSVVAHCSQLVSQVENSHELVKLFNFEFLDYKKELNTALADVVLNLQLAVTTQSKNIYEDCMKHEVLNNVQGQACLYSLAENLSNSLMVRQILTTESLKERFLPEYPGYFALVKVLEKVHVNHKEIQAILTAEPFHSEAVNKYLSVCQTTVKIVKISQE